ncbi:uncharacterized protein LOC116126354 isoform X1 [Pistacia vera]|uniref:uncharacterized protein LOC116126354 isoform X1 n=1 Tax=Pistacia vera TaxID=55513 RepID=UPI0012639AF5|nr:uncharacterized protein LOC116126354 isoform X1 [Pistacia vera]
MTKSEDSGSPGWRASFFMPSTEDVARAVAAAAAAATAANSPRPSVVFSSKDENGGSQFQKLQRQVTRVLKGISHPPEERKTGTYNPEVLTSQKRQWASFQLQYLVHRSLKEPSRLFESMVVVGLHPNCDIQALYRQYIARKSEGSGKLRSAFNYQNYSRVEPNLEPQVLFAYPREKQLPLKYKDLLSFCFPGGVEVHAVERTPSMSELNEILLGQEHLKQSDLSFVFRLQADDSTLYGCCMLVEEIVQKPSGLLSIISDKQPACPTLGHHLLTTRRCYCILSRLPFFELHFGVLNSIFVEERLERLMKGMEDLDFGSLGKEENLDDMPLDQTAVEDLVNGTAEISELNVGVSTSGRITDGGSHLENQILEGDVDLLKKGVNDDAASPIDFEPKMIRTEGEPGGANLEDFHSNPDNFSTNKQAVERRLPNAVLPLLRYYQYESSDSSPSFQGSPCEDRNFRSDVDDTETDETSVSGQEDSGDNIDILEWAKANNHGSLQILCEYYHLRCPARGAKLRFHPLEHLHPLEYHRPDETVLHTAGSTIDLRSCSSSLEFVEVDAHSALWAEEEATALSTWTVACLCGSLRLENVLTMFAAALLEKQIIVVCSNLGILSASVLSIIPLIRPYQWQSLLMPVLPNDMLDFLDAPVPYIVGVKNKTSEVQSKLTSAILVDVNKNQVKAPSIPQLPQHKELFASLSPYHAKLVGESYLGKKRPVYECTDVQIEAAKGFLAVLRSYLDSLCSNLRSHTITNVQSNNDKVSLLLKESFIDSYPSRERPFMKLFVDTQLFSVHTDLVLSFIQKQ